MSEPPFRSFLDLPRRPERDADVVILPLPFERTVSYGRGTAGGPGAILGASAQIELFDEEVGHDFEAAPRIHTAPFLHPESGEEVPAYLDRVAARARGAGDRFVLGLGGEHTVTYGMVAGLPVDPANLTVVQIDAHADLIDRLDGEEWSHGTVMRRLWELGVRLVQIGVRSVSREEHDFITKGDRIRTFFAHEHRDRRLEILDSLRALTGPVYLSLDVDGLDPSVISTTGTPQPGGLDWYEGVEIIRAVAEAPAARLVGADLVEYVPSPHPPGSDLAAAKLAVKILAYRFGG
ncbi:MAG: agmatinase [Candidatus Eisenbacteria bacterium]